MVYYYVNFIIIIYDKELLIFNYFKINVVILVHSGLHIIYISICYNTFENYLWISHILIIIITILIFLK